MNGLDTTDPPEIFKGCNRNNDGVEDEFSFFAVGVRISSSNRGGFGGAVKNAAVALVSWEGYLRSFRLFEGDFFLGSSSSEQFRGTVPNMS